jgi:hypothetical protein
LLVTGPRKRAAKPVAEEVPAPAVHKSLSRWEMIVKRVNAYGDFVDPILKTLLLVGVIFGSYEYFARQQSQRVEKSLALVDEWKDGGHREAWQRINDAVWPLYADASASIAEMKPNESQIGLIYGNLGDAVTGRDDDFSSPPDRDVDQVFYFFERAALCANERICDYDVLNTFLGQEARSFWLYFSRYAERRQTLGYVQYGAWTERFYSGDIRRSLIPGL